MARTTRTRFWRTAPGVAALAALALTACATDDEAAEFDDAEAASQSEDGTQDQSGDDIDTEPSEGETESERSEGDNGADQEDPKGADGGEARGAETEQVEMGDPIEAMTVPMVEGLGEVTIGLHSLVHEGDAMVLTLSFTPDLEDNDEIHIRDMFDLGVPTEYSLRPYLNDRENLKRYSVLGAGYVDRGWQSSASDTIPDGEPGYYWAHFAAPEDEIDTVNISVIPNAPDFEDVEIEAAAEGTGSSAEETTAEVDE